MNSLFYNTNSKPIFVFLRLFFLGKTIFDIFVFFLMEPFSIYILLVKLLLEQFQSAQRFEKRLMLLHTNIHRQQQLASYISECLFSNRTYASAKLLLHGVFINFGTCPFLFPQTFLLAISFSLSFGPCTSVIFYLVFEFLPVSCYPFSGCCECWLLQIKLCLHYKKD